MSSDMLPLILSLCLSAFCPAVRSTTTTTSSPTTSGVNIIASSTDLHNGYIDVFNCTYAHDQNSPIVGLMSMIISKTDTMESDDFKEIAAITFASGQTVQVKNDVGGSQVKGHFAQFSGTTFISYEWSSFTTQVDGRYQCTVHGMDNQGHPVMKVSVSAIEEQTVALNMAMSRLEDCEKTNGELNLQLNDMERKLNDTEDKLASFSQRFEDLRIQLIKAQLELGVNVSRYMNITELFATKYQYTYHVYDNHLYYISLDYEPANVPVFQKKCRENGGYLVEINDRGEWDAIYAFLLNLDHSRTGDFIFVGVTDDGHEGHWTYLNSGADVAFTGWVSGYPSDSTAKNCAGFNYNDYHTSYHNFWEDASCIGTFRARYMCEINM